MCKVATAPTVYGIETFHKRSQIEHRKPVATAPTVYGIETGDIVLQFLNNFFAVATAPTVYGIETHIKNIFNIFDFSQLQQHLPFTVLKHG